MPAQSTRSCYCAAAIGLQPAVVRLSGQMAARDKVILERFDGIVVGFPRGTTVYVGTNYNGPNSPTPKAVSNTLTLP